MRRKEQICVFDNMSVAPIVAITKYMVLVRLTKLSLMTIAKVFKHLFIY